jgi:hypothetical protein
MTTRELARALWIERHYTIPLLVTLGVLPISAGAGTSNDTPTEADMTWRRFEARFDAAGAHNWASNGRGPDRGVPC